MSGSQPNIIMGFRPTPLGPDFSKTLGDAAQMLQIQQAQDQQKRQNALLGIFKDPNSLDKTGNPTPETLQKVMSVDPQAGMTLRQNMMIGQEHALRTQALSSDLMAKKMDMINDSVAPILEDYETAIKGGTPEAQARRDAQAALVANNERMGKTGIFSADEVAKFDNSFDPIRMRTVVEGTKQYQDWRKQNETQKKDEQTGTQLLTDKNGRPFTFRPNAPQGKQNLYQDGTPVPDDAMMNVAKVSAGAGSPAAARERDAEVIARLKLKQDSGQPLTVQDQQQLAAAQANEKARNDAGAGAAAAKQGATARPMDITIDGKPGSGVWHDGKWWDAANPTQPLAGQIRLASTTRADQSLADREKALAEKSQLKASVLADIEADPKWAGKSPGEIGVEAIRRMKGSGTGANLVDDPVALKWAADYFRKSGQMPFGMGGTADREAVMHQVAVEDQASGGTAGQTVENIASTKADTHSLQRIQQQRDAISGYEKGASSEFDLAESLIPKTPEPLNSQALTAWARSGAKQFGDIPNAKFYTALTSALDEYAKVLSGGTGSAAASTDSARTQALAIIPPGATTGQIKGIIDIIKQSMDLKRSGYEDQIKDIQGRISGPGSQQPAQTSGAQPQDRDIAYLRANPAMATKFDARFGEGASQRALQQQQAPAPANQAGPRVNAVPPQGIPVPAQFAKLPDGPLVSDKTGQTFVKRDGRLYPADQQQSDPLEQARAAIRMGAPKDKVIERLKAAGIDTKGL